MKETFQSIHQDLLHLAAGYSADAIIVTTAQLELPGPQILFVNSAFTKMTGYSAAEVIGKTPRILQGKETDSGVLNRLRSELTAGRDFIGRTKNYRSDGTEFELEWIISHLRDQEGRTTHYVSIQRDITTRQLAEEELRAVDKELIEISQRLTSTLKELEMAQRQAIYRERLAALGEISVGVTHDLNNLLSPLVSVIEILATSTGLSRAEQQLVETAQASVDQMWQLVGNLRQFYQGDKAQGQLEAVDVCELIRSVREITRAKWETEQRRIGKRIQFDLHLNAVPFVRANETELKQVLVNLVFNAVDAIQHESGALSISSSLIGNEVVVEVSDTGEGMSDEAMSRCFEPYFTTKGGHGTGFGLSVCYGIVKRHNGDIEVSRRKEGGSVFRVTLPVA